MKILYAAMKYDYGQPDRGCGFEHYNFYETLSHMGHEILYFDFMTLMQERGRDGMNRLLWDVVSAEKPDIMFTVLFTDEFDPKVLRKISEETDTTTINWFCDDHWRFDDFTHIWAPCFNWAVTTAGSALPKYAAIGYENVIKSQWACNHFSYDRLNLPMLHDVAFVGLPHGNRRQIIEALRRAGLSINVWGAGWETGRLSQEDMIRVFNQSRINLNLSNASAPSDTPRTPPLGIRLISGALDVVPLGRRIKEFAKARSISGSNDPDETTTGHHDQIKGRNFEIPGCGGFTLTGMADNLQDYYEPGQEIVCFTDTSELIAKAEYYLHHEDERLAIAESGYQRTHNEHTYAHRFATIFKHIGLEVDRPACAAPTVAAGQTLEIT